VFVTSATSSPQHRYDDAFFDWADAGSLQSARRLVPFLRGELEPGSVVDVGCARGVWLSVWRELGVRRIFGVDGDYVRKDRLRIAKSEFMSAQLSAEWTCNERFDLAQSLEVAEHLPPAAAPGFVSALCVLADVVLFSAAQPGQGGEHHVNERPLQYWRELFQSNGFLVFDPVRPLFYRDPLVEPWYRYNMLLYANTAGRTRLSASVLATEVPPERPLPIFGDWKWGLRRLLLRPLPVSTVSALCRLHNRFMNARRARRARG
jgi:hypothetical protein